MSSLVIAIDGPSASGKSTIAGRIAKKSNAFYISTGNMYRAVALLAIKAQKDLASLTDKELNKFLGVLDIDYIKDQNNKMVLTINSVPAGDEIRTPEVANYSSIIAKLFAVREYLVNKQRDLKKFGLLVMEGRDIGTVVFPDAKYKFFLTATPKVRAKRRLLQEKENPSNATIESVAKEIVARDKADSKRKISPLKKADDAILIDSSNMSIDEVVNFILSKIKLP